MRSTKNKRIQVLIFSEETIGRIINEFSGSEMLQNVSALVDRIKRQW